MEVTKETPTAEPKEEVKESREVRRMRERINEDANKTFVALAEKYRVCFMDNDPDGEEVKAKQKGVDAKWRLYCRNRNLISAAYTQISEFCKSMNEQYNKELNDPTSPEPEPVN